MSINSYDKLFGRLPEDRESPPIDLLGQTKPAQIGPPTEYTVETLRGFVPEEQINQLRANMAVTQPPAVYETCGRPGCTEWNLHVHTADAKTRPTRDEFFLQMAELTSTMATCPRAHCGAVIVRHKRPLSIGYNGAPEGEEHCPSEGEALAEHLALDHCKVSVHAEVNALKNAVGNVYGATIYVYGHYAPCINCRGELERVGITDIRHRPGPHHGVKR